MSGLRLRARWLVALCMLTLSAALMLLVAAPANADDGFPDAPFNGFREVHESSDGDYWTVRISTSNGGVYLASWSGTQGTWNSATEALDALNDLIHCYRDHRLSFYSMFSSREELKAHPSVAFNEGIDESDGEPWFSWRPADGSTLLSEMLACGQDPISKERVVTVTDPGSTNSAWTARIQIPTSVIGAGTHDIFFAPVTQTTDCATYTWPDNSFATGGCLYELDAVYTEIVAIRAEPSGHFPFVSPAEPGTIRDPSVISASEPRVTDPAVIIDDVAPRIVVAVSIAAVLGILIALPTALLESTLETNQSRFARWLRRLFPTRPRATAKGDS